MTLYRWFGSRDGLMVQAIWALARRTLDLVQESVALEGARGGERIVAVVVGFLSRVIENQGMQRWLSEEGEHAMRLLTRHETGFQPRLIAAVEELLVEEEDAGEITLGVDRHELAFVIVRLIESYAYLDLITGERADAARAEPILRMLLRLEPVRQPA